MSLPFTCPRTCPLFSEIHCRFRPVLDQIGPVKVHSHTARIRVEYTDLAALEQAVKNIGGQWLGVGTHRLFEDDHQGNGFYLPFANGRERNGVAMWNYPIVLEESGQLAYDDYGGRWGDVNQLKALEQEYAYVKAELAAQVQGWQTERTSQGVTIYHPSGGSLTVSSAGQVEMQGFHGKGCHEALMTLGLPLDDMQATSEYVQEKAQCQIPG